MIGIIAYSFAWRREGHSPCNQRLALTTARIAYASSLGMTPGTKLFGPGIEIVAQRTIADILAEECIPCHRVPKTPGYEGSEQVTEFADQVFRRAGVTYVIPIAQPIFQLTKCLHLIRSAGYTTPSFGRLAREIGWVGFDQQSVQPATRSLMHLAFYTLRQMLTGYRPPTAQSEP